MAEQNDVLEKWLPIIGKALAHLCLQQAETKEPEKFDSVLKRVDFLQGLGLSMNDAAEAAGSSAASVREMIGRKRRAGRKHGKKKKGGR